MEYRFSRDGQFQSTLPIQGETERVLDEYGRVDISIHSPYTGRDIVQSLCLIGLIAFQSTLPIQGETFCSFEQIQTLIISIHSPYTGRDTSGRNRPKHGRISIHSPYTGRDGYAKEFLDRVYAFQSTLPIQGETHPLAVQATTYQFQSTLPIQGETAILHIKPLIYSQSLMQNAKQKNFFQHLHNKL